MDFEIVGEITHIESIAIGRSIRELARLHKQYGKGRWRKVKGVALVRLRMVRSTPLKSIGMRLTASGERNSN